MVCVVCGVWGVVWWGWCAPFRFGRLAPCPQIQVVRKQRSTVLRRNGLDDVAHAWSTVRHLRELFGILEGTLERKKNVVRGGNNVIAEKLNRIPAGWLLPLRLKV